MKTIARKSSPLWLLALTGLLLTSACKKDPENTTPAPEKLLTGKTWMRSGLTIDPPIDWFGSGTMVTDLFAQLPGCFKDDLITFESSGAFKFDEGDTRCSDDDPWTRMGTWALNQNQNVISVTENGDTESWIIRKLENSELMVDYLIAEDGINYTLTATYRKR